MKKLSRAKRSGYLARCKSRIEAARGFRKHEGLEDLWERLADLYKGKHFPKDLGYDDAIAVNICFSTINVIAPSVSVNRPKTRVRARRAMDVDKATITEAVVNYWWSEFDILPEFQLAVKDSLIFGLGWLKTGYRFVEEEEDDLEEGLRQFEQLRAEVEEFAMANPDMAGDLPTDEELRSQVVATKRVVRHDQPFVERVSIKDVFVDPEATSLRDAKWVAQKLTKTLEEVRHNEAYKATVRRQVRPDSRLADDWMGEKKWTDQDKDDCQRVTVWEFYDLQLGQMCVFADLSDDFLVDPVAQPYAFGQPFIMVPNYTVPDQFYPMGELEALEPLQAELNLTRTAMFNDRKAFRRAWLYKAEAFDVLGRAQLQSDADNRLIPVNGNQPLNEVLVPLPTNAPNPQLYQDSSLIEADIQNVSGVNEYMRGGSPDIRRTATEASIIQDAANARAADKLAKVEGVIGLVSRRLVQLSQQYMDSEKVARIAGPGGRDLWVAYSRDDIDLEADFEVEAGSSQPLNPAQRRQTAIEMLQALAPFGDPQMGMVNMKAVIAYALKHGFEVDDPGMFLAEGANPDIQALGAPPEPEQVPPEGGSGEEEARIQQMLESGAVPNGATVGQGGAIERPPLGAEGGPAPTPDMLQGAF